MCRAAVREVRNIVLRAVTTGRSKSSSAISTSGVPCTSPWEIRLTAVSMRPPLATTEAADHEAGPGDVGEGHHAGEEGQLNRDAPGTREGRDQEVAEVGLLHRRRAEDIEGVADQAARKEDRHQRRQGHVHEPGGFEEL